MDLSAYFKIGYIAKTHGLKGEVTVSISSDAPDFTELDAIFIEVKNNLVPHFITASTLKFDKAFVKFDCIDSIEQAEQIKGCSLYLLKEARPKPGRGQFYFDEIVDFAVHDEQAGVLGRVVLVSTQANNPQIVVQQGEKEILIPVNSPFIKSVNKSKKTISVTLPDGFLAI